MAYCNGTLSALARPPLDQAQRNRWTYPWSNGPLTRLFTASPRFIGARRFLKLILACCERLSLGRGRIGNTSSRFLATLVGICTTPEINWSTPSRLISGCLKSKEPMSHGSFRSQKRKWGTLAWTIMTLGERICCSIGRMFNQAFPHYIRLVGHLINH